MSTYSKKNVYPGDIVRVLIWCVIAVPISLFLKRLYHDGTLSYSMYEIYSVLISLILLIGVFRVTNFHKMRIKKSRRQGWYTMFPITEIEQDTHDTDVFVIKATGIHPVSHKMMTFCSEPVEHVSTTHAIGTLVTIYYDKKDINWYYMDIDI